MKKRLILGASLVGLLAVFLMVAGCGDGGEKEATQTESATTEHQAAEPAAAEHPTAEHPTAESAAETAAVHDCAGDCGMHAVAEADMTEIDGKWYCAGCAKKVQAGKEGHGEG